MGSDPKQEHREGRPEDRAETAGPGGGSPDIHALEVGGGAAAGALIGRLVLGGIWGVVIGAALGAIAGSAVSAKTRRPAGSGRRAASAAPRKPAGTAAGAASGPAGAAAEEPLESWTKARLYERARDLDISGRSGMSKAELIRALRRHPDFSPA